MEVERTEGEKRELTEVGGESKKAKVESEKEGGDSKRTICLRIVEKIRTQEGKEMKRTGGRVNHEQQFSFTSNNYKVLLLVLVFSRI